MNAKTFFKYFASLFFIIIISIFVLFLVCYITIYKDKYIIRQFKNEDYYLNIQESIKKSINELDIDNKENIISIIEINMIEEDVNNYISSIYNGDAYTTHSSKIESLLIDLKVDESNRNKILNVYEREIRLNNNFNLVPKSVFIFMNSTSTILLLSINIVIVSYLYLVVVCKYKNMGILILLSSIMTFLLELFIHRNYKIKGLFGWFNELYTNILSDICFKLIWCGILLFIGGIIIYFFEKVVSNNKDFKVKEKRLH